MSPLKEMAASEYRVFVAHANDLAHEFQKFLVVVVDIPIDPADLVVLAIGVVVAILGASHFIAGQQHGNTLRQQ